MVRMDVEYKGGLRCEAVHGPSGSRIETDAPADNHGRAERFSPTDLVGAALATCAATIMGILAERKGWRLEGMRIAVTKEMTAEPPRRIARLTLHIRMPLKLDAADREAAERAAATCPVIRSLHPEVRVETAFEWPD